MKFFIIFVFTLIFNISAFADSVGVISAITGEAQIQRDGKTIRAVLSSKLQEHDIILTKKITRLQIIFTDDTIVTLGQNSNFVIQKYSFKEDELPIAHFLLQKGTMRASTGKIGKQSPKNFIVKTKDMKIGVMGTDFTISISKDGVEKAYCTSGAISVATDSKRFKIPAGVYLTRQANSTREIAAIPEEDYQAILLNVTKGKTNFTVQVDKKTQKVEIDGKEYEVDNGTALSLSEEGKIDIGISNTELNDDNNDLNTFLATAKDNQILTEIESTPTPTAVPAPTTSSLTGFNIEQNNGLITNEVILNFNTDSSLVTTLQNSYVYLNHNNWFYRYKISDTPIYFNSEYDFEVSFSSFEDDNSNGEVAVKDTYLKTESDIDADDHMTWGVWSAKFLKPDGTYSSDMRSLWIAGELTDASIITNYRSTSIQYTGSYRALNYRKNLNNEYTGVANMNVNFGADTATLDLLQVNGKDYSFNMTIFGNSLSGTQAITNPTNNGYAQGNFYGPTGDTIGGQFLIETDTTRTNNIGGVFQVKALTPPN